MKDGVSPQIICQIRERAFQSLSTCVRGCAHDNAGSNACDLHPSLIIQSTSIVLGWVLRPVLTLVISHNTTFEAFSFIIRAEPSISPVPPDSAARTSLESLIVHHLL